MKRGPVFFFRAHRCARLPSRPNFLRDCRCVELRALCDEVPRTPPGPEGSNGTGIASCAAEYPKFLSSKEGCREKAAGRRFQTSMSKRVIPGFDRHLLGIRAAAKFLCGTLCSSVSSVLSFCFSGSKKKPSESGISKA